ncbi:MAG: hypothetical protein ACI82F_001149 [Planctomycetota bacterium]|jgi:hypothetical protein
MNKQLGRFELLEQIDEGGSTTVYRAVEHMGQGITRPAAVKVMRSLSATDEEQIEALRREVEVLIELGGTPNIVSIMAMGVEEDMGAWIAMELAGKSLKHSIGDGPAQPDSARVLLRDTLRALVSVHGARSRILHRDIKPQNILNTGGVWKVADFGLAKKHGSEDTMALATVKYAAPELLDANLGEESARLDLYSLGLVVYEYALGNTLFRQQFPSIYDPSGGSKGSGGDDRPKWMYWHTSQQMVLPPLEDLIEGYPKDLSDLVAAMTAKPAEQRIASADEALRRLGEVSTAAPMEVQAEEVEKKRTVSPVIAVAAAIAMVVAIVGGSLYYLLEGRASIELDSSGRFVGAAGRIQVTGSVDNYPAAGRAEIRLQRGRVRTFPVALEAGGKFTCDVSLLEMGVYEALMIVKDSSDVRVARASLTLERVKPETVLIELNTSPSISGVSVTLRSEGEDEAHQLTTDGNGMISQELPYGDFSLEVFHPRYSPLPKQDLQTGIDAVWSNTVSLVELDYAALTAQMQREVDRLMGLMRRKTDCPPGPLTPAEEEQVVSSMDRLRLLADGDDDIGIFLESVKATKDCDPSSMVAAPALPPPGGSSSGSGAFGSDPAIAINRVIKRIEGLIDRKVNCPPGPPSEFEIAALAKAIDELASLAQGDIDLQIYLDSVRRVADCDPSSRPANVPTVMTREEQQALENADPAIAINLVIARIERLIDRKVNCPPGPPSEFERAALVKAIDELAALAADDIDLLLYIDGVRGSADCDPSSRPANVPSVKTRAQIQAESQAESQAEAASKLASAKDLLEGLTPENLLGGRQGRGSDAADPGGVDSTIAGVLGNLPANPELVAKLMAMPLGEFADFVRSNVPTGAIEVEVLETVNKVRLQGPLFSTKELELMILRVAYGMARIEPELTIDAWGVSRKLSSSLSGEGASGVQVDAYLVKSDPTLFVQFLMDGAFGHAQAKAHASSFVVDQGLLWVRGYEQGPVTQPDDEAGDAE